jgi:SAM-dependent methyltransferase
LGALPAPHVDPEGGRQPEAEPGQSSPGLPAGRLIRDVGADLDPAALEADVRGEVDRKLREGVYPAELLRDVAPDQVRDMVDALRGAAHLSVEPPVRSSRPFLGRLAVLCKLTLAKLLRWYSRWLVGQMQTLGSSTVSAMGAVEERLRDHERRLDELSTRVALEEGLQLGMPRPQARMSAGSTATARGSGWRSAWRWATHGRILVESAGPIAVLGCGAGEFLALLDAAGADCYGVEPHAEQARCCLERGLTVRREDALAHLRGVAPGSLGGILLDRPPEGLGQANAADLFRLAAAALAPGGVLVVETVGASAFEPHPQDASPLGNLPLTFFAVSAGFADVQVRELSTEPEESRLHPVPVPTASALGEVIGALNENLRRLDEAMFGPRLVAVVARR